VSTTDRGVCALFGSQRAVGEPEPAARSRVDRNGSQLPTLTGMTSESRNTSVTSIACGMREDLPLLSASSDSHSVSNGSPVYSQERALLIYQSKRRSRWLAGVLA
jgi:hypothetical protein